MIIKQLNLILKSTLRIKLRMLQNRFGLKSAKILNCFFLFKYVFTLVLLSALGYFLYKASSLYYVSETYSSALSFSIGFVFALGSTKTALTFIKSNLTEYSLTSSRFGFFVVKTILLHPIATIILKLNILIPIIVWSFLFSPISGAFALLGVFFSYFLHVYILTKNLAPPQTHILSLASKLGKTILGTLAVGAILKLAFSVMGTTLSILKTMLSTKYDEDELLQQLIQSVETPAMWLIGVLKPYALHILVLVSILLLVSLANVLISLFHLWQGNYIQPRKVFLQKKLLKRYNLVALPFIKPLCVKKAHKAIWQIMRQPEIIVSHVLQTLLVLNAPSDIQRIFLLLWLHYIANANYIRALYTKQNASFGEYSTIDLYHWRLSGRPLTSLYDEKIKLLEKSTASISLIQVIFTCTLSLATLDLKFFYVIISTILVTVYRPMKNFNCKLAIFGSFVVFAKTYAAGLTNYASDENDLAENRLHVFYKRPLAMIPMIMLVINYFWQFMSLKIVVLSFCLFVAYIVLTKKLIARRITKGGNVLETANCLD